MKPYTTLVAIALSLTIASCGSSPQTQVQPDPNPTRSAIASANSGISDTNTAQPPDTKTETIYLEGEPYEITLQRFEDVAAPFTTYYAQDDIITDGVCSEEGCGFRFSAKTANNQPNEAAYLHFFFPQGSPSLASLRQMYITGKNSMMDRNPSWQTMEILEDTEQYPWIQETTAFFDEETGAMGRIMLGRYNDQAIAIIEYMEGDYGDGFAPRFQTILENVEFKS